MPFRLPAELMDRIDKAANYCGQTRQAFVQAAVLAEVAEVEERKRMKQLRVSRSISREPEQQEISISDTPKSSFIETLRQQRSNSEPSPPPSPTNAQGQVVVNVGSGASASGGDSIERLAAYVVTGNEFERDSRLRTAVDILKASASTDEEKKVLAARLDEAVAAKTKKTGEEASGVVRVARLAFDKIADIWK